MARRLKAKDFMTSKHLLATWRKLRRRLILVWRDLLKLPSKFDPTKPLHLVLVGIILGTIIAPVAEHIYTNELYRLSGGAKAVAERPSPKLMKKLEHDAGKQASIFNADGAEAAKERSRDQNQTSLGASGNKDNQLYTATMPDDASRGIEISDNVSGVSFKFVPKMSLLGGRTKDGQVVYPLKGQPGHLVFTPKANGVKEDIVLDRAPESDTAEFTYDLQLPDSVQARLDEDGSVGFYTGTPELFGNISYGTDKDRELIEKSRKNSAKTYLMFKIPAPTIRETGKPTNVAGRFALDGSTLTVRVANLKQAHYPIAIDPTFYITSTTDFILGSIDDNIDLSVADQVGRAAIGGGSTPDWNPSSAPNLTYAQFSAGLVAYNGFLYLIGGGCTSGGCTAVSNDVRYICLNPNTGALGTNGGCTPSTWTNTGNSLLNTARQGLVAYGYNGYLYAVGGENASAVPVSAANSVEFAKINSDGTVGTWNYTGHLSNARSYPAGAIYQGVMYAMGGSSGTLNATPQNTTEYARINGDGTIGSCDNTTYHTACTWSSTSSFTTARNRFRGAAYNGYVYIAGGRTSTPSVLNDVQYAAIQSDGTLGTWQTSATSFPIARRDLGMGVNNGYIYIYGGCQQAALACPTAQMLGDTYYAVLNADGTIGQWQQTLQYNYNSGGTDYNPRVPGGTTFYSNHLYFIGGCYVEAASTGNHCTSSLVGTFITSIDSVGRFDKGIATAGSPPYTGTSTVARMGAKAVALNGYMYYIGGCSAAGCDTYDSTVEYAAINADGSLGNFSTTTALSAGSGNSAGRMGHTLAAYNNKIYVIGGTERTTAGSPGATPSAAAPTTTTFASSTTHNVNMPGTVNSGDLLLAFFTNDANSTVTTPSGWTQIATAVRTTQATGSVYAKKAAGTEGGTTVNFVTSASRAASANVYRVTGWSGDLGGVVAASVVPGGTTAGPNPPSLTTSWGSANNLWFAYAAGSTWATTSYPGSYTGGTTSTGGSGTTGASTATAQRAVAAATEDPGAFTMTSAQNGVAFTVAVQPALAHSDAYMSTILSATQNSNGTLGSWGTETNGLTGSAAARAFHTTEIWHNYVYVLGGLDSSGAASGNIYYSQIGSSGALGAWAQASTGITARWGHSGGIWGNWMYVVGGQTDAVGTYIGTSAGANAVQQITINPSTGNTSSATGYAVDVARRFGGGYVDRGILYSFGGDVAGGSSASSDVSRAGLNSSTGAVGTFDATNIGNFPDNYPSAAVMGLDTARSMTAAVSYGGYAYVLGGCSDDIYDTNTKNCQNLVSTANTSEEFLPNNGGTGQLGSFSTGSGNIVDLPTVGGTAGRADHAAVAYNGKLYIIGGCRVYTAGACSTGLGDIQRADISPDGTITSSWTSQTSLPGSEVRSGLKAIAYNGYLYVMGGRSASAAATGSVWYVSIDNTGTLGGSWNNVSNALNNDIGCPSACTTRRDFGAAISGGYLYVVGGIDNGGTRQATVYLAAIDQFSGTIGSWTTTTSFTTARSDFGFVAYNGVLYVAGGYDGSNTLSDVQYGNIGSNGTISAWNYTTDIAAGARARQMVGANGYMYFFGDEGSSGTRSTYTSISSVGALGSVSMVSGALSGAHPHGAAVFYNGFFYDTGGCTLSSNVCSTVTAANDKTGQQAVSRTGHYSKLFDTQVDTTPTQLVVNGVDGGPGSLVEFKFQTASSGDPVLGVPQLIRPVVYGQYYNVQALNSSGSYVGQAFQYQYLITLDDSRAGTFPDVPKSGSQTAVTDVTLYYHANPARRLRHGASFTNNGCNDVAANGCILDTAP